MAKADPRETAEKYMADKKILKLFEELGTSLVHNRPENPNQFLIEQLKKTTEKKASHFFTEQDVKTMFSMFDTTQQGHITKSQYAQALKSLGIDNPCTLQEIMNSKKEKIAMNTFVSKMKQELEADKAVGKKKK